MQCKASASLSILISTTIRFLSLKKENNGRCRLDLSNFNGTILSLMLNESNCPSAELGQLLPEHGCLRKGQIVLQLPNSRFDHVWFRHWIISRRHGGPRALTSSWRPFGPLDVIFCVLWALRSCDPRKWWLNENNYLFKVLKWVKPGKSVECSF